MNITIAPHDWLAIRQALSLLTEKSVEIHSLESFFTQQPRYISIVKSIQQIINTAGLGELSLDKDTMTYIPKKIKPAEYNLTTGPFSSCIEILLFLLPVLANSNC